MGIFCCYTLNLQKASSTITISKGIAWCAMFIIKAKDAQRTFTPQRWIHVVRHWKHSAFHSWMFQQQAAVCSLDDIYICLECWFTASQPILRLCFSKSKLYTSLKPPSCPFAPNPLTEKQQRQMSLLGSCKQKMQRCPRPNSGLQWSVPSLAV